MKYVVLNNDNTIRQVSEALGETEPIDSIKTRVESAGFRLVEVAGDIDPSSVYNPSTGEFENIV